MSDEAKEKDPETQEIDQEKVGRLELEVAENKPPEVVIEALPVVETKVPELHPEVEAPQKDDPRIFARLNSDGIVLEIIKERENIEEEWHPDLLSTCVEITNHKEQPEVGWQRKGNGQFGPYQPEESPSLKTRKALIAGFKSGKDTFEVFGSRWQDMLDEAQHVATFNEFSTGESTLTWKGKDGKDIVFESTAGFLQTVKSLSRLVAKWKRFEQGTESKEPETTVD